MNLMQIMDLEGKLLGWIDVVRHPIGEIPDRGFYRVSEQPELNKDFGIADALNTVIKVADLQIRSVEFRVGRSYTSGKKWFFVLRDPQAEHWLWNRQDCVKFRGFN